MGYCSFVQPIRHSPHVANGFASKHLKKLDVLSKTTQKSKFFYLFFSLKHQNGVKINGPGYKICKQT